MVGFNHKDTAIVSGPRPPKAAVLWVASPVSLFMQYSIPALNLARRLFFSVFLLALSTAALRPAVAQTAPATIRLQPNDAARGLNGHQHNFYFLPPGKTGEDYQNAGFFGQNLRPYLGNNAEALANLNDYRRQKTLFLADRLVAVGALGLYGSQVFAKDGDQQYFNGAQQVAAGLFVASLLATIPINRHTNQHLQHAVSAYNGGLTGAQGTRWQRWGPSTAGLRLGAQNTPLLALVWGLR